MLLRYLKRARSPSFIWPPSWGRQGPRDTPRLDSEGTLVAIRRIGNRLSVIVRFDGQDYVALPHEWKPPPTVEQVAATLERSAWPSPPRRPSPRPPAPR